MPAKAARYLWGQSRYNRIPVLIYIDGSPEFKDGGQTSWEDGELEIDIAPEVLAKPRRLREVLIHEFTHCIEYLNDPSCLSPKEVDGCTLLAQTIESGMSDLLHHLKVGKRKFRW